MSDSRILIYGGCCAQNEHDARLISLWSKLVRHANPNVDVVLLDSLSPFDPARFTAPGISIFRFEDNPGHLARGGGDGAGRTFCKGIELAAEGKYDYAVHWETDFIFRHPVRPVIAKMQRAGVKVCALMGRYYQFLDWGLCPFKVDYMVQSKFVERYDWRHRKPDPIPELVMAELLKDDVFVLPYYGLRNNFNEANVYNLASLFPYGPPDFITQCYEFDVYLKFLELSGIRL